MATGYWIIRTYKAGRIGEKVKFWVAGNPKRRCQRRERQTAKKLAQNLGGAVKKSARLLNVNFSGRPSCLLGLDYSDEGLMLLIEKIRAKGIDWDGLDVEEKRDALLEQAGRELNNVLARVNYELKKKGERLMYYGVTADLDGLTGEPVRVHHHLVVPAGYEGLFAKKWERYGSVDWKKISERQEDLLPVAVYLCQQVRHRDNAKMYIRSRNLAEPQVTDRVVYTGAELKAPRRARVLSRSEYKSPFHAQYLRYSVDPEDTGGKTERRDTGGDESSGRRVSGEA